jgi:GT2 family glycosyltransferase
MSKTNTISVILPIKSGKAVGFQDFFEKCIQSVKNQGDNVNELIIVHGSEDFLTNYISEFDFSGITVVTESWVEKPSFAKQVNRGVEIAKSNWCSILEFDDEYSNIWFKNALNYMDIYKDVEAFLPIVVDVDEKFVFAGFTNEATFAANISSEIGMLNNETLQTFQNFQISGMVFSKEKFQEVGGIKSNLKLTFGYELLLRLTHNSTKIMTIPRIGYKHINLREGSIFWNYKNGEEKMNQDEAKFWIDTAKKEYFFTNEREINYEPQEI